MEDNHPVPGYVPTAPLDQEALDIPWSLVVDLVARRLNLDGLSNLSSLQRQLKLSGAIIEAAFRHFQKEKLVEIRGMEGHDYVFALTRAGHQLAADRLRVTHYAGPAPVPLAAYHAAVRAQAARPKINRERLRGILADLVVRDDLLDKLGPALISQKSLFLFGPTGNGKTSLAERLVRVYEDAVVIPYAVEVDGQIIVVYDPVVHQRIEGEPAELDPRWVVCRRPEVMVGGELSAEMLELRLDAVTNIYAAPVQMKANNGILVVDDFGRQVMPAGNLLNRWILPLDRKVDYLNLSYGLKFQVPFQLMIVFSTNLEPARLLDAAFLRRIPNKVWVHAVDEESFREIFRREASEHGLQVDRDLADHLIQLCRRWGGRELRACYPRDVCEIAACIDAYEERPHRLTKEDLERAVELCFAEDAARVEDESIHRMEVG